jgi:hypothetical protein
MDAENLSHHKDSMTLACDLVRQFVNIAVGGMAFAVGMSLAVKISLCLLWAILIVFGLSVAVGLLFLMHAIGLTHVGKYDVYKPSLRWLSLGQILLVAVGVYLLCFSIL